SHLFEREREHVRLVRVEALFAVRVREHVQVSRDDLRLRETPRMCTLRHGVFLPFVRLSGACGVPAQEPVPTVAASCAPKRLTSTVARPAALVVSAIRRPGSTTSPVGIDAADVPWA